MALRTIGQGNNDQGKTTQPTDDRQQQREERRREREERRDRNPAQDDRDEFRDSFASIRAATQNVFGERTNPTRALTALAKYAKSYIESKVRNRGLNYSAIIIEHDVAVPSIVIVSQTDTKDEDGKPLAVIVGHAILLVDYTRRPESLDEVREGSVTYQDTTVWADAFDRFYIDEIEKQIPLQLENVENIQYLDAGCSTINFPDLPVDKLTGDTSFQSTHIDNLLFTVLTAVEAYRSWEAEEYDRMLRPEILAQGSKIVADINLQVNSSVTPTGLPVAEDFMIRVREVRERDYRRGRDERDKIRSLNKKGNDGNDECYGGVSGRIDFIQIEAEAEYLQNPRIEDAAVHVPEFIIAGFDVYDRSPSLPMLLQMISSVGILGDRNPPIFLQAFRPENLVDTPSRNLGALAMELKDIKTRKAVDRQVFRANTPDDTLRQFARAAIVPDCRIGIEIPSQGPLTSLLNIIWYAAIFAQTNNEDFQYANDMIIQAADILTGNRFSEKWDPEDPVMVGEISIIPGGYWSDDSGEKRDTREMGYLFYANLENPKEALEMSREYADSFMEPSDIIAANTRKRLITEIKGTNFVQTDNFRRCYFTTDFIDVLNECLRKSGLGVMTPNFNFGGRGDERRRRDSIGGLVSRGTLEHSYGRYSDRRDDRHRDQRYRSYQRRGSSRR